jgi:hypothetical protein
LTGGNNKLNTCQIARKNIFIHALRRKSAKKNLPFSFYLADKPMKANILFQQILRMFDLWLDNIIGVNKVFGIYRQKFTKKPLIV